MIGAYRALADRITAQLRAELVVVCGIYGGDRGVADLVVSTAEESARARWASADRPDFPPVTDELVSPSQLAVNRFEVLDVRQHPGFAEYFQPFGWDQLSRMLVYDQGRFCAWVGWARATPVDVDARLLRRLERDAVAHLGSTQRGLPSACHLVVDRAGDVLHGTPGAVDVLDSRQIDLQRLVRRDGRHREAGLELEVVVLDDGARLVSARRAPSIWLAPEVRLTPRQRDVARVLSSGCSTEETAASLGITVETVRKHLQAAMAILGVHSRLELALLLMKD